MVNPQSDYKEKYSHLIGKVAAKDAAHAMEANKAYGCGESAGRAPWGNSSWALGSPGGPLEPHLLRSPLSSSSRQQEGHPVY